MTQPNVLASPQRGVTTTTATAATTKSIVREEHLPCGTVYIWNCAGELYGIECALCDDRPLCTLTEFADHMEVWHRAWSRQMQVHALSVQSIELADVHEDLMQEVLAELTAAGEIELISSAEASTALLAAQHMKERIEEEDNELKTKSVMQATSDNQGFDKMFMDMDIEMDVADAKVKTPPAPEPFEEIVWIDKPTKMAKRDEVQELKDAKEQRESSIKVESQLAEATKIESGECSRSREKEMSKKSNKNKLPVTAIKKLTAQHVSKLIELYKSQPRLWNQSHAEFGDTELCRRSWQAITKAWNKYCRRSFSITDVRIRISTLCQRFMKQRERLEAEGELDECAKFVHFESLTFLVEQQTLQNRRKLFENENRKLMSIYRRYPVLWLTGHRSIRTPNERTDAYRAISDELKALGIQLTAFGVQRRVMSLRKCYRLEKIRYLHGLVEGGQNFVQAANAKEFESEFKLYRDMAFLHKHIDPYVCAGCGKIFENLVTHREHVNNWNQSCWQAYDESVDEDELTNKAGDDEEENEQKYKPASAVDEPNTPSKMPSEVSKTSQVVDKLPELFNDNANEVATSVLTKQPLVVKVQCEQFSYNLHLCANTTATAAERKQRDDQQTLEEEKAKNEADSDVSSGSRSETLNYENCDDDDKEEEADSNNNNINSDDDNLPHFSHKDRLSVPHTNKLIALYKSQPTLWDPNHLDFHSRKQRRLAWHALTDALNSSCQTQYNWQILHRKLTDYTKYYKREKQRIADPLGGRSKWYFYKHFRFLDDALIVNNELQKTLQQRDNNLKIIEVYKAHPQLWCTDHPDYSKRKQRQRHTDAMCTRLQEECNIQITPERLKTRLIEFRCQYRHVKQQRLKAAAAGDDNDIDWQPGYEYYDVLKFLERHVSPFICTHCGASYKRRTEYLQHERNMHEETLNGVLEPSAHIDDDGVWAQQLCHICGLMFSMRNNLLAHLKRHLGERNFACPTCPKRFFNSTALNVHMRSHTKELPYVCELCARGFVNASKLNQHVKRHRNQRDFKCNRCDKAFFTGFERERHLRSHLNIRDKICPICGRAFVVGSAYYAHLNLHRDSKRYCCDNCGLRFAQYAGLYKHRKRCNRTQIAHEE